MPFQVVPKDRWTMRRTPNWGDVYWFDFGYPVSGQRSFAGFHPALVVVDSSRILKGTIQIVPLSGKEHQQVGYAFHVSVMKAECPFLDKDSIVKVDQMYCVPTNELPDQYLLGAMPLPIMKRIYVSLLKVLGVDKVLAR